MTTVLITCEGEMRTHTTASLGTEASGSAGGTLRGFVCASVPGFACVSFWLISLWPLLFLQAVHPRGADRGRGGLRYQQELWALQENPTMLHQKA